MEEKQAAGVADTLMEVVLAHEFHKTIHELNAPAHLALSALTVALIGGIAATNATINKKLESGEVTEEEAKKFIEVINNSLADAAQTATRASLGREMFQPRPGLTIQCQVLVTAAPSPSAH